MSEDIKTLRKEQMAAYWKSPGKKVVNALDWVVDKFVLLICILIALMCLYAGYDTWMVYYHANDDSVITYKPKESIEETKKKLSDDCVAWLTLDDTTIDYPVMQGVTNDQYLNMDPYGDYSLSGSIFLDSRNSSDFTDDYNLLYGHHMDHNAMFGALDDYQTQNFFDSHRTGTLVTSSGTYDVTIFAVVDTNADCSEVFDPTDGYDIMGYLADNAMIYEKPVSDHIIGMSTCESAESTGRLVVYGALTPQKGQ